MKKIIDALYKTHNASDEELKLLIESENFDEYLFCSADNIRKKYYGTDIYIRGLIEISSYCKRSCLYCGIRAENTNAERYRLSPDEISDCCDTGYALGFRTFVLQGGEDDFYTDEIICKIISDIKKKYPDCAVTLSVGEKTYETYLSYYRAGADRYLLRHETADNEHYHMLHPENMNPENRKQCLRNLKHIGFQTGSGFLVGSPFQRTEHIIKDIRFLQEINPEMIGIGPFVSHHQTPFASYPDGSATLCIRLIAILRLLFPSALIPATTALGTVIPDGRERGIKAGANVVMPNLSPSKYRKQYDLYDNKICTGEESAQCIKCLESRVKSTGFQISYGRGDFAGFKNNKYKEEL